MLPARSEPTAGRHEHFTVRLIFRDLQLFKQASRFSAVTQLTTEESQKHAEHHDLMNEKLKIKLGKTGMKQSHCLNTWVILFIYESRSFQLNKDFYLTEKIFCDILRHFHLWCQMCVTLRVLLKYNHNDNKLKQTHQMFTDLSFCFCDVWPLNTFWILRSCEEEMRKRVVHP